MSLYAASSEGANPNSQTYTLIIDHLVRSGHLAPAIEVFALLPSMHILRTSKKFNLLAEAFASTGKFDGICQLLDEMRFDGIIPGPPVRAAIAKLRSAGYIDETEEFVKELSPDERIVNAIYSCSEDEGHNYSEDAAGDRDCCTMSKAQQLLLYSSLLQTVLKCQRGNEAMDILVDMMLQSVLPDAQTFSSLMEFFCW